MDETIAFEDSLIGAVSARSLADGINIDEIGRKVDEHTRQLFPLCEISVKDNAGMKIKLYHLP